MGGTDITSTQWKDEGYCCCPISVQGVPFHFLERIPTSRSENKSRYYCVDKRKLTLEGDGEEEQEEATKEVTGLTFNVIERSFGHHTTIVLPTTDLTTKRMEW